jgi:hypothetical protein
MAFRSLFVTSTAGLVYAAHGVNEWDGSKSGDASGLPLWRKSLFLPGGKALPPLVNLLNSIPFWKLKPKRELGDSPTEPRAFITTGEKDVSLAYLDGGSLNVPTAALPRSMVVTWLNARSGEISSGSSPSNMAGKTVQFNAPSPGKWLLLIKSR